jgi:hypothetical protein
MSTEALGDRLWPCFAEPKRREHTEPANHRSPGGDDKMRRFRGFIVVGVARLVIALAASDIGAGSATAQPYPAPGGPTVGPAPPSAPSEITPLASLPAPAHAPSTFAGGLQLIAYPYLWLPGLNMAISTPLTRAPRVDVGAGAFQLLGDLDNAPFMGAAELRYGPFGILGDALHLPLGVPVTTGNIFFTGGGTSLVTSIGTGSLLYRVVDQPTQSIDGGLGFRSWGVAADLTLIGRLLPAVSVARSGGWTDPLLVGRYHRDFGNGVGLTAYGDVGGFGIAAHADWQIVGTLDYAWNSWHTLHLGYRSLNVNYQASGQPLGFDVHLKGPILAATLRF